MKKAFLLFTLFIVTLSACQKTSNSSTHPTTYMVTGITDAVIGGDSLSTLDLSYFVNYVGPIQETVTISLADLPSTIVIDTTFHSATTGIPSFNVGFRLINMAFSKGGKYTIKLMCDGSVTGKKYYTFMLKILPKTPIATCDSSLVGTWDTCTDFCLGGMYADAVSVDGTVLNRIHFANFQSLGSDVYADLNCSTGTLTIPHQTVTGGTGTVTIYGGGSFANKLITYNVTDSTSLGSIPCSGNMTRP